MKTVINEIIMLASVEIDNVKVIVNEAMIFDFILRNEK